MADPVGVEKIKAVGPRASLPVVPLVAAMMLSVLVAVAGVGGVVSWLVKSGRLPVIKGAATVEAATRPEAPRTRLIPLDPLLVNLADDGGRSYLRVAMTLRVDDPAPTKGESAKQEKPEKGKPVNENDAAMRDTALDVLGHETGAGLLAPEGKERLKLALRAAMAQRVPEVKVVDVLFTEFLVQR